MNFDPQNFFVDPMDFYSILLPRSLLTYLLRGEVGTVVLRDCYVKLAGAKAWVAFLFASYLLGRLVFLLGSWLDKFYDWAWRYALKPQITLTRAAVASSEPPGTKRQPEPIVAGPVRRTS